MHLPCVLLACLPLHLYFPFTSRACPCSFGESKCRKDSARQKRKNQEPAKFLPLKPGRRQANLFKATTHPRLPFIDLFIANCGAFNGNGIVVWLSARCHWRHCLEPSPKLSLSAHVSPDAMSIVPANRPCRPASQPLFTLSEPKKQATIDDMRLKPGKKTLSMVRWPCAW